MSEQTPPQGDVNIQDVIKQALSLAAEIAHCIAVIETQEEYKPIPRHKSLVVI